MLLQTCTIRDLAPHVCIYMYVTAHVEIRRISTRTGGVLVPFFLTSRPLKQRVTQLPSPSLSRHGSLLPSTFLVALPWSTSAARVGGL